MNDQFKCNLGRVAKLSVFHFFSLLVPINENFKEKIFVFFHIACSSNC
jgi:hypothetical protein